MPTLKLKRFGLVAAVLVILYFAGQDDGKADRDQYCNNVRGGYWPDYARTFKDECGGKDPPKFKKNF
jgi:hypothetical protein